MTDYRRIIEHIPDAAWRVDTWVDSGNYTHGSLDVADRKRLILTVLEAAQAAQDHPRRDDTPSAGGVDGQDAPDAPTGRTRDQAYEAIDLAQTQGGQAGIASGLAAIAYAILAGQETP